MGLSGLMLFRNHIDGVARNFHYQIGLSGNDDLTTEPGILIETPSPVQHILLEIVGGSQGLPTFANVYMAGCTGARQLTRVLDRDIVVERQHAETLTGFGLDYLALGANGLVGKKNNFRHLQYQLGQLI